MSDQHPTPNIEGSNPWGDQGQPEEPPAVPYDETITAGEHKVGAVVEHTYFDPYVGAGGTDVKVRCLVVDVADVEQRDPETGETRKVKGYRLMPLTDLTDPVIDGVTAV
jgi:hypothetical protein